MTYPPLCGSNKICGYALEDAAKLAENAQILMNVSEYTDISSATDSLISALKAFGYSADESLHVIDIFNTIGESNCLQITISVNN